MRRRSQLDFEAAMTLIKTGYSDSEIAGNPRNISISHRKSVALMDELIGPKC